MCVLRRLNSFESIENISLNSKFPNYYDNVSRDRFSVTKTNITIPLAWCDHMISRLIGEYLDSVISRFRNRLQINFEENNDVKMKCLFRYQNYAVFQCRFPEFEHLYVCVSIFQSSISNPINEQHVLKWKITLF